MTVLLINRYNKINGGADTVFLNTQQLLSQNGIKVITFTLDNFHAGERHREFYGTKKKNLRNTLNILLNYFVNIKAAINLLKLIKENKIDVCNIHLYIGTLSNSIVYILNRKKIPIVHTVHDYRLLCPANALLDKNTKLCESCINGNILNSVIKRCSDGSIGKSLLIWSEALIRNTFFNPTTHIEHFVFVSNFSKNKHLLKYPELKNKSTVIYNFSSSVSGKPLNRGRYLLYFGRLSPEKGIKNLITVCLKHKIELIIAGDGPLRRLVEKTSKANSNIQYVGKKGKKELKHLIENSSFIVVPSIWYENNPMSIIESFHLGKPVIGSNLGGIPELLNNGRGIIFENDKQNNGLTTALINALKMSKKEYQNISRKCLDFATSSLSDSQNYEQLITVFENVHHRIHK